MIERQEAGHEPARIEPTTAGATAPVHQENLLDRFSLIFSTGFSEIKRKSSITRLNFEIKGLERDKERHFQTLGKRAWEAHVEHSDVAGVIVNLKELQIEMNRLETQVGEHDSQIQDIEASKAEITEKFNQNLDELEKRIVPHRQKIESINAEKEDNKIQIEELRSKQDQLSVQVREHQKVIQELDLGDGPEKGPKVEDEKRAIRDLFAEKCEIELKIPFHLSTLEKLKIALAGERTEIEKLDQEKDAARRDYEQRIKDYNHEIHELEDRKKQASRQKERFKHDMEPFLYDLGKRVDQLRLQPDAFKDVFATMDDYNRQVETRRNQIYEAETLSRAMDRSAWTKFLIFSGSAVALVVFLLFALFHF